MARALIRSALDSISDSMPSRVKHMYIRRRDRPLASDRHRQPRFAWIGDHVAHTTPFIACPYLVPAQFNSASEVAFVILGMKEVLVSKADAPRMQLNGSTVTMERCERPLELRLKSLPELRAAPCSRFASGQFPDLMQLCFHREIGLPISRSSL